MRITITARHMELNEAIKAYAEQKAEKLGKYYDRLLTAEVIINHEAGRHEVEVLAHADHHTNFVAKHAESDPYAALDQAMKEIERQITRHKERFRNRKHSGTPRQERDTGSEPSSAGAEA